ncbi:hypothetical protein COHA_009594 [Chlorella ohadii]|uniref:Uncharacterized protein n=1 Tax=Chlorella ohadii TaxID=2649997 RepID=A0AAD5DFA2_9CHLO|nr:hypothetical protein COHA_009594 [Chlorella ohadii]
MGLKFMQRGREKEEKKAAEAAAEEREAEAHWVVEGARTRCVVLAEGDPPPAEAADGGRISFGGFNAESEERRRAAEAAEALAAAEDNPEGVVITDEGMAAALQKREMDRFKSVSSGAGRYFDTGGSANHIARQQRSGGKDRGGGGKQRDGGKQHGGGGKQHGGKGGKHGGGDGGGSGRKHGRRGQDEGERGPAKKKGKFQRYF